MHSAGSRRRTTCKGRPHLAASSLWDVLQRPAATAFAAPHSSVGTLRLRCSFWRPELDPPRPTDATMPVRYSPCVR